MSIKRINFTNRSRLTREQANVVIHPGPGNAPASFDVILDLDKLRPHADAAKVFVEAYHQTTRMRFDFGTVSVLTPPTPLQRRLDEFPDWKDIRFRIKVTDVDGSRGRILAWADRIKPKGPDDQDQPDLVRFKDADLNGLLWDLEFDDEGPVVLVERISGGAQTIGRDDRFIAAVYPEILRRTLEKALLEDQSPVDDDEHWFKLWYEGFLKAKFGLHNPPAPGEASACREWIAQAVSVFARQFQIAQRWNANPEQPAGGQS